MLGISNSQCGASNFYTPEDNIRELTFTTGEEINAGDFVKVMSRDAFTSLPVQVADGSAANLGGMSLPTPADPKGQGKWMQCFSVLSGWSGARNLYSLKWPNTLEPNQFTWGYITDTSIGGGPAIQLSEIQASSWGEPLDIGDGYWLIPGMGSDTASKVGKDGIARAYPSQILLCHVDPTTGTAVRCTSINADGTENVSGGVDYTNGGYNYSQYGSPVICKLSPREYVMLYEAVSGGVYQVMARHFTVEKIADSYITFEIPENTISIKVDEVVTVKGDILKNVMRPNIIGIENALYDPDTDEWKEPTYSTHGNVQFNEQELSLYYQNSIFFFYGHCCNFTNPETREIYTLTNSQVNYVRISVDADGILRSHPERYVLDPVISSEFNRFAGGYTSYTQIPMSMPYYNQFGLFNVVRCSDNKTLLYVHNYFYFKFVIDYDTHIITCSIHPMLAKNPNVMRMWNAQSGITSGHNLYGRDVYPLNCNMVSPYFTGVNNGAVNNAPYLYPMSKNRFLMCYTAITSHGQGNSNSNQQRNNVTVLVDFNDELGTLEQTCTYGIASWANGTSYPESNYMNPRAFLNMNNYVIMLQSRWIGSNSWCINGQLVYFPTSLGNSVQEMRAWKVNSESPFSVENELQRAVYYGIAKNHADAGYNVTIKTTLQKEYNPKKEQEATE